MKEVIFVLLDQWADWESAFLGSPLNCGIQPGRPIKYTVKTMSIDKEPKRSLGNFQTLIDYDIETMPEDYAALVLIGGMSWFGKDAERLAPLVKDAVAKGRVVGAICNASVFLGMHGLLNDVKHTSNTLAYLQEHAGSLYTNEQGYVNAQAVNDKKIVTANGTGYLEFTRELLLLLDADMPEMIEGYYNFNKLGLCKMMKLS